jgi:hypothetical protein
MYKMERTKHGRGLALVMGLTKMHVCACVLLELDERLYFGIDYCMCVICWTFVADYVPRLIIACV